MENTEVFSFVCERILCIERKHPVKVGVDGITASGKSTFAKTLLKYLQDSGREVIYTTLDGFHNPKKIRHAKGRTSPDGYYWDAYNYDSVISELLEPLGPCGNLNFRTEVFDLKNDVPIETNKSTISRNAILVVDGSFALREKLIDFWDYKVYLKVAFEIAEKRAAVRDKKLFGSSEKALETTKLRYHAAHRIHLHEAAPTSKADIVIDNNDPLSPKIVTSNEG